MDNLFLITGSEAYERNEMLEKIKMDFGELEKGINYITLDNNSISSLENEISTYAFGYSKKLIVVKINKKDDEEKESKSDLLTDSLMEELSSLSEAFLVVFIGDNLGKSKLYKFVEKHGKCFSFDKKKENELNIWCKNLINENGISISNADLSYLVSICGTEKQILKNEIDKLSSFAMETKKITKEDIDKLCIKTSDVIIFDLTDSLGTRNTKKALRYLDELLQNKEPIQKIMIMIAKHFKSLLVAKIATKENKNLLDELSTKSPYAANKYKEQARRFEEKELVTMIQKLAKLDVDSKIGKIDLKIGLEKLICEY